MKVIHLVKVEGTLEELRELFLEGAKKEAKRQAKEAGKRVVRSGVKQAAKRTKSAWQKYISKKSNQIKFKRGPRKGQLDLKRMSAAYKRSKK